MALIPFENRQSSRPLLAIVFFVISLHCLFVVSMWFSAVPKETSRPLANRLKVQTVTLSPPLLPPTKYKVVDEKFMLSQQPKEVEEIFKESLQQLDPLATSPQIQIPHAEVVPVEPKPQENVKPKVEAKKEVSIPKKEIIKKPASVTKKATEVPPPQVKKVPPVKPKEPLPKAKVQKPGIESKATLTKTKFKEELTSADFAAVESQKKIEAEQKNLKAQQQAQQDKLFLQAKETIAKIDQTRDKVSSNQVYENVIISLPGAVSSLQIDGITEKSVPKIGDREASYRSELASRLKLLLKLPEYGEVNIKLTLDRSGKVLSVVIVSSESGANRKYIEKILPTLMFPGFGTNFGNVMQYTFSITLSNDF